MCFPPMVNTACANSFGSDGGAYLSAQTADGTEQKRSRIINYKTSTAVDRGWERLETVFTTENAGVYSLYVNMYHMSNVVVFDDFQLEEVLDLTSETGTSEAYKADGTASTVNLLQAGSFDARNTSGATICSAGEYWSYSNSIAAPELTSSRGYVMAFTPSVTALRHVSQTVNLNCSSNTTFLLSAWGQAPASNIGDESALTGENSEKKRFFGMIAKIIYSDTTTAEYQYVSFNDDVGEWQYACGTIVPKREDKTITSITVYLASDLNPNTAYIDDVALIQEPVQTYSYDDNGNLLVATNSEGKTSTEYDSSERLTKYTTMSGVSYTLTYSGTSRDVQKITSDGVQTTYTYNAAGEVTQTQTKPTSGSLYLQSSAVYSTDKNFKTSATDVNGSVTQASYNSAKGLVTSTTAANGTKTYYSYNANNDRQTVNYISGVAAMHFSYNENGLLSLLARKSFSGTTPHWQAYAFSYNAWGQTEEITVQRTDSADGSGYSAALTLASYDYADNGGNLEKMTYPNGQYVTYEYDLFDRLVREVYYTSSNTVQADYRYVYDANGALAKQYAVSGGNIVEEYDFEYDSLGRFIRSRELNAAGTVKQRTEHLYDEANRLTQQSWTLGTDSFTETYTYNSGDGSLNTVTTTQIGSSTNRYDSLKRLNKQIYATKTGVNYSRWYTYADSRNVASTRVASFAYRNGSTSTGTLLAGSSYSYNTDGTISAITDLSTGAQITYSYDALGQLTDEYRYNSAGTLQSHEHYLYDTAGNLRETVQNNVTASVYSYDNAQWQDLLTAYNGVEIGYEGQTYNWSTGSFSGDVISGNPINWYNGQGYYELTWSQGRRLTYLEVFGADQQYRIDYAYDMEGIRTQKTVEAVTHYYVTQNGKVVQETWGTNVLQFVYDTNGSPYAMRYSTDSGSSW